MSKTLVGHVPAEPTIKIHNKALNHANIGQENKGENGQVLPRELFDNGQGKSATPSDNDRKDGIDMAKQQATATWTSVVQRAPGTWGNTSQTE